MKKKVFIVAIPIVAIIICLLFPFKVKYKIYSIGRIFPEREWVLGRNSDDRLTSTIKNNLLGTISSYGNKEFQKGDVFDFFINTEIVGKKYLKEGEVVGFLQSKELKKNLEELEDQLKVEQALLTVNTSGQKSEVIIEAQRSVSLAQEQFNIKKKLLDRKTSLFNDSLISSQEYDIAMNEYETSRITLELAKAKTATVSTGEKPEQIAFSKQKIISLRNQINGLNKRLVSMEINTPFSGMMLQKKLAPSLYQSSAPYLDILANLADTSNYVIMTPVPLKEIKYIQPGQKVRLRLINSNGRFEGEVSNIDNVIQIINGKQTIFITARITNKTAEIMPGYIAQATIESEDLSIVEYAKRMIVGSFY